MQEEFFVITVNAENLQIILIGKANILHDLNILSDKEYRDSMIKIERAKLTYIGRIKKGELNDIKK